MTWTTDGFYERRLKIPSQGRSYCAVVEMECSALAGSCPPRGAVWGPFTADSLADLDNHDSRDWGSEA